MDKNRLLKSLQEIFGSDLHHSLSARKIYSCDASIFQIEPMAIVFPKKEEQLVSLVKLAGEHGVTITCRGGGSSLAGQGLGPGIIVDMSVYMNKILAVDPDNKRATVQPGVNLDILNRQLANYNLMFAPDPSSSAYCTIGGMIANNSGGSRDVKYGTTRDHLHSLSLISGRGERLQARSLPLSALGLRPERKKWKTAAPGQDEFGGLSEKERDLWRQVSALYMDCRTMIEPMANSFLKDSSSFNLKNVVKNRYFHPQQVLAASEGTLAIITEAGLKLEDKPEKSCLVIAMARDLKKAAQFIQSIYSLQPSRIELLHRYILETGLNAGYQRLQSLLQNEFLYLYYIEFEGADGKKAKQAQSIASKFNLSSTVHQSPEEQAALWSLRKMAVGLVHRLEGKGTPIALIEDAALPIENLSVFLTAMEEILGQYGIKTFIYGHAASGNIHIRPFFQVRGQRDLNIMIELFEQHALLVKEMGGVLSGEHGLGRLRSAYFQGIYPQPFKRLFYPLKHLFDPLNILNRGVKLLETGQPRARDALSQVFSQYFKYNRQVDSNIPISSAEVEKCHGCGKCRDFCPSYLAEREEINLPRARHNLLRQLSSRQLLSSLEAKKAFSTCLGCGKCQRLCPSRVDTRKLVRLWREYRVHRQGSALFSLAMSDPAMPLKYSHLLGPLSSNLRSNLRQYRDLQLFQRLGVNPEAEFFPKTKKITDLNRLLLKLTSGSKLGKSQPAHLGQTKSVRTYSEQTYPKVVYFPGCFASYVAFNEESLPAVALLKQKGFQVVQPSFSCCGFSAWYAGETTVARRQARSIAETMAPWLEKGFQVVYTCPSCGESLAELLPSLVGKTARIPAGSLSYLGEILTRRQGFNSRDFNAGLTDANVQPKSADTKLKAAYHIPCHQSEGEDLSANLQLLAQVPGLEVEVLSESCCGMAGSFGLKADVSHISEKLAAAKIEAIGQTGADLVISPCGACRFQIERHCNLPAVHPVLFWGLAD